MSEVAVPYRKFLKARMPHPPDSYDYSLREEYSTWAITVGSDKELNYGQIHDLIHRDIAIGNDYRKERIKLLITLATGVFALTATFHKDVFGSVFTYTGLWLVVGGLAMMIVSLWAGIVHFRRWEDFYLEHRARGNALWRYHVATAAANTDQQRDAQIAFHKAGQRIEGFQESYKKWDFIQSTSLVGGMALIAAYVFFTSNAALEKAGLESVKSTQQGAAVLSPAPGASAQNPPRQAQQPVAQRPRD